MASSPRLPSSSPGLRSSSPASYPRGLYDFVAGFTRFATRTLAYTYLLCDPYPSFGGADDPAYPVRMEFQRLERYNRAKTFFRFLLAIPIVIVRYVMGILLEIGAVAAWIVILITGKMPRGLFDLMLLANSYTARSDAYVFLLSETYPPFQDEQTRAAGTQTPPPPPRHPPRRTIRRLRDTASSRFRYRRVR